MAEADPEYGLSSIDREGFVKAVEAMRKKICVNLIWSSTDTI